jgi:uncharacterized protein DUF1016
MRITKKYNKSIPGDLIGDIRLFIETARHNVAAAVNAGLTILYWQIGNRIRQDILKEKRAEYGKEIVVTVSRQLSWSHFVGILPIKDDLQRDFYAEMCRMERWSVRTLREKTTSDFMNVLHERPVGTVGTSRRYHEASGAPALIQKRQE